MASNFDDKKTLFNFVVQEGNGVKGMVDLGLSKVPKPYIQPNEERIDETLTKRVDQPPIDLSQLDGPNHDRVVREICTAAETLGFFQVVNHGLSIELLDTVKTTAHKFFSQCPKKKACYRKGTSSSSLVTYGTSFTPEKETTLEWKDYVSMVYTNDVEALQYWPEDCREVVLEYLKASMKMVKKLVKILLGNLGVTDESTMNRFIGLQMVNMNFYPTCPNPDLTVGVGRHSDMGTLTILLQDGIGGLYVKLEDKHNQSMKIEEWVQIPPIPGALVVNIGDMIQILSNGRYRSAEHLVRTTSNQSRVSVPIFMAPLLSQKIGPLPQVVEKDGVARYREILFQDYMNNFFGKAHDGKKSLDFAKVG